MQDFGVYKKVTNLILGSESGIIFITIYTYIWIDGWTNGWMFILNIQQSAQWSVHLLLIRRFLSDDNGGYVHCSLPRPAVVSEDKSLKRTHSSAPTAASKCRLGKHATDTLIDKRRSYWAEGKALDKSIEWSRFDDWYALSETLQLHLRLSHHKSS